MVESKRLLANGNSRFTTYYKLITVNRLPRLTRGTLLGIALCNSDGAD